MIIRNCPFCGGTPQVKHCTAYGIPAVRVMCSKCHVSTPPITEGVTSLYRGEVNKHFTIDEATAESVRWWNLRTA